jgi:hypothetical protein
MPVTTKTAPDVLWNVQVVRTPPSALLPRPELPGTSTTPFLTIVFGTRTPARDPVSGLVMNNGSKAFAGWNDTFALNVPVAFVQLPPVYVTTSAEARDAVPNATPTAATSVGKNYAFPHLSSFGREGPMPRLRRSFGRLVLPPLLKRREHAPLWHRDQEV